jgi:hypothetical protein
MSQKTNDSPYSLNVKTFKTFKLQRVSVLNITSITNPSALKIRFHGKYKQIKPNSSEADLSSQQLTCPIYCCGGIPGATLCCPFTTTIINSKTKRQKTFILEIMTLPVNKNIIIKCNNISLIQGVSLSSKTLKFV